MRPPSSVQSHLRYPLTSILASGACVRVLRALSAQGGGMGATQLAERCGLSRAGARLVLDTLVAQQVVDVLGGRKSQVYVLSVKHPLAGGLEMLFRAERERWEGLMSALRDVVGDVAGVRAAWYFGSVARGEDRADSDLDIALVAKEASLEEVVEDVRERLRRVEDHYLARCSVVGLSEADVMRLAMAGDPWWQGLARDAKPLRGEVPLYYVRTLNSKPNA